MPYVAQGTRSYHWWMELAERWTPKCPACERALGYREICENQDCKYNGMLPHERYRAFCATLENDNA